MRLAVAGGTGVVGRYVVDEAVRRGHEVVVLSRHRPAEPERPGVHWSRADVVSGDGVREALAGVDAVVDCTNAATMNADVASAFFRDATRHLTTVGAEQGVRHHVVLSIVGIDDVPTGYYRGKLAHEQTALAGPVPATVLRATQFHEFPGQILARTRRGPLALMPRMRVATVAAAEVGRALVELAEQPARGRAPDLGGPEEGDLADLARRYVRALGERVLVLPVRMPGAAGRAVRAGALVPKDGARGRLTFDAWLADEARRRRNT